MVRLQLQLVTRAIALLLAGGAMMRRACVSVCALALWITGPAVGHSQTTLQLRFDSLEVNGTKIVYRSVGSGDPLLLLHGFTGTGDVWSPLALDLATQYSVIIPDLRGHGRSTNPSDEFTHRQAASDVYALLDHLNIRTVRAVGASTGGMTLLHMATTQPDRVEAMVLIGATSYFPEQARRIMRANHPDSVPRARLQALARAHSRGEEQARMLLTQFHAFKDSYNDMNFTAPLLSTIRARTLIIHGDRDQFFPVSIPVEEYLAIPRSYLWIIPNGGHAPIPSSDPARQVFWDTVTAFLRGEWQ